MVHSTESCVVQVGLVRKEIGAWACGCYKVLGASFCFSLFLSLLWNLADLLGRQWWGLVIWQGVVSVNGCELMRFQPEVAWANGFYCS